MRPIFKVRSSLLLFFAILLWPKYHVLAAEQIRSFNSDILINQNASIDVVEEIVYDFGTAVKHGIFRDIPVIYPTDGSNRSIGLSRISVTDEKGAPQMFTESQSGNSKKIKIGNPNVTLSGMKTYKISYNVVGAINYFDDHDELYWNVTGSEWQVPIGLAQAKIRVQGATSTSQFLTHCYYGQLGSKNQCSSGISTSSIPSATYSASGLFARQGLTAVLGFPKGSVDKASANLPPQSGQVAVSDEPISKGAIALLAFYFMLNILIPVIAFIVMYRRWRRLGRDPKVGTIIPQYDAPAGVSPALVGAVVKDEPSMDSYTGEIINLAIMGYLKINHLENTKIFGGVEDFELIRLKTDYNGLKSYQQALMQLLFSGNDAVKLSSLSGKCVSEIDLVDNGVNQAVTDLGYYHDNPGLVRKKYMAVGGLMLLGIFIGVFGLLLAGIIVMLFGYLMPAKTLAGAKAKEHLLGLKMYLSVAEKDRLEFHNAPEKSPEQFEKLLPYAIALDVTEQWSRKFEGIYQATPNWYNDPLRPFAPLAFAHSMSNFNSSMISTGVAASSGHSGLGGGGFSGGGFGGGGGGSW